MLIYRMCCQEEFEDIINKPSLRSRFQFYATNIEWLIERVCDGNFNNSKFKPSKYAHLVVFEISNIDLKHFRKQGINELILDRRDINLIQFRRIL